MKQLSWLFIVMCGVWLSGCATEKHPFDKFNDYNAQRLFEEGEQNLLDDMYTSASEHFEALDADYPFSQYSQQAQLNLIYAYYMKSDYVSADMAAERYIRLYPRSKDVDYAYYLKGLANYNRESTFTKRHFPIDLAKRDQASEKQAFSDFRTLLLQFPHSIYAADARQRMLAVRNRVAQHNVEVGAYYFSRRAYVAAANRAAMTVQTYPNTPVVLDALLLMKKSYEKLKVTGLAQDTQAVLALNYTPKRIAEAEARLFKSL